MTSTQSPPALFPVGFKSTASAIASRHAYHKGDKAYISFNNMHHVALVPPTDSTGDINDILRNCRQPSSALKETRYASLALRTLSPQDRLMKRLKPSRSNIPYTRIGEGDVETSFVLDEELVKSWQRLERSLEEAKGRSLKFFTPDPDLSEPPLPSSFQYAKAYRSFEELYRQVQLAKSAFDLLIAWVVYVVVASNASERSFIRNGKFSDKHIGSWPKWCKDAIEDNKKNKQEGFEPGWLNYFLFSQAFDFRSPRVGMFISTDTCAFLDEIPLYLCAGVPFTVICPLNGADDSALASSKLPENVKNAFKISEADLESFGLGPSKANDGWGWESNTSAWTQEAVWNPNVPNSAREARLAEALSRTHDHWLDYFFKFEKHYQEMRKIEDQNTREKQANESRRVNATEVSNSICPKKASVFLWKPFDEDPSLWERKEIFNREKIDQWVLHEPHERVFDEYNKCWDLCKPMGQGRPAPVLKYIPADYNLTVTRKSRKKVERKEVEGKVLRPYLDHPLWLERYAPGLEDSGRADSCPAQGPSSTTQERPSRSSYRRSRSPERHRSSFRRSRSPSRVPKNLEGSGSSRAK